MNISRRGKSALSSAMLVGLGMAIALGMATGPNQPEPDVLTDEMMFPKSSLLAMTMSEYGVLVVDRVGVGSIVKPDGTVISVGSHKWLTEDAGTTYAIVNLQDRRTAFHEIPLSDGRKCLLRVPDSSCLDGRPPGADYLEKGDNAMKDILRARQLERLIESENQADLDSHKDK